MMYAIVTCKHSARLCRDGKFRHSAFFGTFPECVKLYKKRGWAEKKHSELKRRGINTIIIELGQKGNIKITMDSTGNIIHKIHPKLGKHLDELK